MTRDEFAIEHAKVCHRGTKNRKHSSPSCKRSCGKRLYDLQMQLNISLDPNMRNEGEKFDKLLMESKNMAS